VEGWESVQVGEGGVWRGGGLGGGVREVLSVRRGGGWGWSNVGGEGGGGGGGVGRGMWWGWGGG